MPARPREIFAAVALVAAADVALWRGSDLAPSGLGAAAFFVAVPALLLVAARAYRLTLSVGVVVAILATIATRCAFAPTAGTALLGLGAIFALAIAMRSRSAFLTDVVASFGSTFATLPPRYEAFVAGFRGRRGSPHEGPRPFAQVAIPAVLVTTFVTLFALANPLVARWLGGVTRVLSAPGPGRIVTWVFLLMGAVLLVRPAVRRSLVSESAVPTADATRGLLNVTRNALVPLNVVFFVYNALDARYLWAGAPPPGVSEQHYAHEGAAWLTVTIALLTVVVGIMFRGALAHDERARLPRLLAFAWLGQGAILALGTFRRLAVHITTSGLSNVRILGMFGTAVVAVALALVGVKLVRRRTFLWLLRRQLDTLAVAGVAFCVMPTHLISAHVNVARVLEHEYQALVHAEEEVFEAESAAALLPLLDHDDERIRRGAAALLLDERDSLRATLKPQRGWLDGDIATRRASVALETASPKLEAVLGDVVRSDAITPFEYIRNSSIEGAIAQSEIAKVKLAPTRSQVAVERWMRAHDLEARGPIQISVLERPAPDVERAEGEVTAEHSLGATTTRREVVLLLERRTGGEWQVLTERGAGGAMLR